MLIIGVGEVMCTYLNREYYFVSCVPYILYYFASWKERDRGRGRTRKRERERERENYRV